MRRALAGTLGVNILITVIGASSSLIGLSLLGPEQLAAVGVTIAAVQVVANLLDLRLADLCARRLAQPEITPEQRADVLAAAVIGGSVLGLACLIFGIPTAWLAGLVLEHPAPLAALIAIAFSEAVIFMMTVIMHLQRFSNRPYRIMAGTQLAAQITLSGSLVTAALIRPDALGWACGLAVGAFFSVIMQVSACLYLWRRHDALDLRWRHGFKTFGLLLAGRRQLLGSMLLGWSRLLHRCCDVILVGLLCSDRDTGLYRCARSLADLGYTAYSALDKVLQPRLLTLATTNNRVEFRRWTGRSLALSMSGTLLLVTLVMLSGEMVFSWLFHGRYAGVESSLVWFVVPYAAIFGIHLWAWPALVAAGSWTGFAIGSLIAAVVCQFGIPLFMIHALGWPATPALCAAGYALFYVTLYLPTAMVVLRRMRTWPSPSSPSGS